MNNEYRKSKGPEEDLFKTYTACFLQLVPYMLSSICNATDLCLFDQHSSSMSPSIFGHKMNTFNNKDHMLSHSNQGWGRRGDGATSHNLGQSSVVAAHSQTICYGQGNTIGQD